MEGSNVRQEVSCIHWLALRPFSSKGVCKRLCCFLVIRLIFGNIGLHETLDCGKASIASIKLVIILNGYSSFSTNNLSRIPKVFHV